MPDPATGHPEPVADGPAAAFAVAFGDSETGEVLALVKDSRSSSSAGYWGLNPSGLLAEVKACGFEVVDRIAEDLVRFGTKLVEVQESIIQAIKNRQDPQTGLVQLDPVPVEPGDRVKVFDGPMAGLEGIFKERKGEKRALLLMSMLGTESLVEVDALLLQKAV